MSGGCLALACLVALAGGPNDAKDSLPNRLVLRIAARPAIVSAVTERLAPRLAALGVALDVTSTPEINIERVLESAPDNRPDAPLARGWLDGQDIDGAVLLLIPRRADRVLIRKVPLMLGVDEAGLAQITFIFERSMASLLASEPIGVPHADARAAISATLPAHASAGAGDAASSETALRAGLFGGIAAWSSTSDLAARVGLDLWFDRLTPSGRVGVGVSAVVDPGFHSASASGDLLVRAVALHASVSAGRQLGRYGTAQLAAGPALLVTRIAPTLPSASLPDSAVAARTDLDPVLGLAARWDLPLGRVTGVFVAATVDVVPLRAQYTEVINGANRALFSPWPVRPGLLLGISAGSGH